MVFDGGGGGVRSRSCPYSLGIFGFGKCQGQEQDNNEETQEEVNEEEKKKD